MTKAEQYAREVVKENSSILSCRFIHLAAERFLKDLERKDIIFDQKRIDKVTYFHEKIVHVPELAQSVPLPLPHAFWIQQLHGWVYKDTGLRRFNNVYCQMARKGFKSFYAATNGLYELCVGTDHTPQVMMGANNRDQAIITTELAGKIVKASPQLRKLEESGALEMFTYRKKVTEIILQTKDRNARMEAMPRDMGDGSNPSLGIIDEFHEAKDTSLLETIQSGQGQRLEPLTIVITSPGHDKSGPCYSQLRDTAIKTLEGTIENDRHLAILFELDSEEEWENIDMMEKSNPMLPYSGTLKPFLIDRIAEAKLYGGGKATNILIKNCGLWVDQAEVWIPSDILRENTYGVTDDMLIGQECYCGLDLSAGGDLNAFTLMFPSIEVTSGQYKKVVKTLFWIPKDKLGTDSVDYLKWVEDGYMRLFDGDTVEYDVIAKDMIKEMDKYNVICLAVDPKYFATGPASYLKDTKYLQLIVKVQQGFGKLAGATETLEQWLFSKEMDLMGNKCLLWNFGNVELRVGDMGDRMPSKGRSHGRIDGVAALVTAIAQYIELNMNNDEFWVDNW